MGVSCFTHTGNSLPINLRAIFSISKGLALGNALSDPYNMLEYGEFVYQTGLVDRHGYHTMKLFENLAKEYWPEIESKIVRLTRKNPFDFWSIFILIRSTGTLCYIRSYKIVNTVICTIY